MMAVQREAVTVTSQDLGRGSTVQPMIVAMYVFKDHHGKGCLRSNEPSLDRI